MKLIISILYILAGLNYIGYSQWIQTAGTPEGAGITDMLVTPNGTIVVTCASYNFPNGQYGGIRHSTDGGNSWQNDYMHYNARTLAMGQNGYVYASSWDYPNISEGLWVSFNQGAAWVGHLYLIGSNNNIFSILVRNNNQTIYIGTRTGVRKSTNGGGSFTPVNNGIPVNSWVRDIEIDSNGIIAAATTNGLFVTTNSSASWTQVQGVPPGDTVVTLMFVDNRDTTLSASGQADELVAGSNNGNVLRSTCFGLTYTELFLIELFSETEISKLRKAVQAENVYFFGSKFPTDNGQGGVVSSSDGGKNWNNVNSGLPSNPRVSSLEVTQPVQLSSGSTYTLYAGLFENINGGAKVYKLTATIGIQQISSEVPNAFSLSQNYPNPFNPTTNIEFALLKASFVKLAVYDMLGREVETLVNKELKSGTYKADWNASSYPSGVYFYKLVTDNFIETKKMILVK